MRRCQERSNPRLAAAMHDLHFFIRSVLFGPIAGGFVAVHTGNLFFQSNLSQSFVQIFTCSHIAVQFWMFSVDA